MVHPILLAAAVIPAIFLVVQIYRADQLEREPLYMIVRLVFWGAVCTYPAALAEQIGISILDRLFRENSAVYNLIQYFFIVALAEEGCKYIILHQRSWASREFNCQFDGVVYAVCVSLGFALWENINYVFLYGMFTALVRAVTAVPGHGCFGVFMGAFYGMARRYENFGFQKRSRQCRVLAVVVPLLLHGTYDYLVSAGNALFEAVFLGFVVVLFLVASAMVRGLSRRDRYIRANPWNPQ